MAGLTKPKVYTGVSAALSVADENGTLQRVAYATGFTLDLSANTEDFNVLGERYQLSIPTYLSWSASSDAKASFENKGQAALIKAYDNQDSILCEFILNNVSGAKLAKMYGYASIESLSIDAGEGVTGMSISLKGAGRLGRQLPSYTAVTGVSINKETLSLYVGSTEQLIATVSPSGASDVGVTWSSSDTTKATVDEIGFVTAIAAGEVTITATSDADSTKTDTCTVTVSAS